MVVLLSCGTEATSAWSVLLVVALLLRLRSYTVHVHPVFVLCYVGLVYGT